MHSPSSGRCPPTRLTADEYGAGGTVVGPRGRGPRAAGQARGRLHAERHDGPADRAAGPRRSPGPPGRRVPPDVHLELHEDKAYQRLHGLVGRPVGEGPSCHARRPRGRRGAAGRARCSSCRSARSAAGCRAGTTSRRRSVRPRARGGRPPRRRSPLGVAARSTDVRWPRSPRCSTPSTSRSTRASAGCPAAMLLGEDDVIAEAREWRRRHGGTLFQLWPYAAAGLAGLRLRLPRMAAYVEHAQAIAAVLAGMTGVQVVPDPPQTPMMHLHLETTAAQVTPASAAWRPSSGCGPGAVRRRPTPPACDGSS